MKNPFVDQEWELLRQRLGDCARHLGDQIDQADAFLREADEFGNQAVPQSYSELLKRVAAAAELTRGWQAKRSLHEHEESDIDEALDESFPASDPPAWSTAHA
jgi:hypothetical protein